jgi:hypothetical protein
LNKREKEIKEYEMFEYEIQLGGINRIYILIRVYILSIIFNYKFIIILLMPSSFIKKYFFGSANFTQ